MIRRQLDDLVTEPVTLQVYVWLVCHADDQGVAGPISRARLAALLGATQRKIRTAIGRLQDRHLIVPSKSGRVTKFRVVFPFNDQVTTQLSSGGSGAYIDIVPIGDQKAAQSANLPPAAVIGQNSTDQKATHISSNKSTDKGKRRPGNDVTPIYIKNIDKYIGSPFWDLSQAYVDDSKKRLPSFTASLDEHAVLKGAIALDRLTRIEGYDLEDIKVTLRWARKNGFWSRNLLSLGSLRKKGDDGMSKYDKIRASMETEIQAEEHPGARELIPQSTGCTIDEWRKRTGGRNSIRL
jgi:hypothetical protein